MISITLNLPSLKIPDLGTLKGIRDYNHPDVAVFYRVPFALPPVNERRFLAPEEVADWSKFSHASKLPSGDVEIDASQKGAPCVQLRVQFRRSSSFLGVSNIFNPHTPVAQRVADKVIIRRFQGEEVEFFF